MSLDIPGLIRIETHPKEIAVAQVVEATHSVYPHEEVYGQYCTLHSHIDCPPDDLFAYLADVRSLGEWTYTTRDLAPTGRDGLWRGRDLLSGDAAIYVSVTADPVARTVDYHCAWDQGTHLWMIYLMRVVDAEAVLDRPGSVVLWTNCRHPYYDANPFPDTVPEGRPDWVGDYWDVIPAGHQLELNNLKAIAEHRHARNRSLRPPEWFL
jgi:hypothetical protein